MTEINLRQFEKSLIDTFRRYLFTLNFISDNERELRDAFWTTLIQRDTFQREPLLSAIPAYDTAESAQDLLGRPEVPRLHQKLSVLSAERFDVTRPLYKHQIEALRLIQEKRNVIVATGTGSGKTECFLLPLLDEALRNSEPGVRAIIIYPMNALANDQLSRMRELLQPLPEVTFGRYTGDTPLERTNISDDEKKAILDPNERYSRIEIRNQPPHILLTNFAMLEYLLLRPQDNDIFRQQRLKYVVLDEAHTYNGAQGIEVGLLMRRLQQAFPKCSLQFILTSATLGDNKSAIAEFGQRLTGAPFSGDDVILGSQVPKFKSELSPALLISDYLTVMPDDACLEKWIQVVDDPQKLRKLIQESGLAHAAEALRKDSIPRVLYGLFERNAEMAKLYGAISKEPLKLSEVAQLVWGDSSGDALRLTEWLVLLGARAIKDQNSSPLLPARYHIFLRGLRGAALCLSATCQKKSDHPGAKWSDFVLENRTTCETCGSHLLPITTCVHCGTPVLKVYSAPDNKWQAVAPRKDSPVHLLSWLDISEESPDEKEEGQPSYKAQLCLSCKALSIGPKLGRDCCQDPNQIELNFISSGGDGLLKSCPFCGGDKGLYPTVLREFQTGEDAATAVIAEAMIRALPLERADKPAHGRQLLAFSDSRQRAAFFAPYLERTTAETQYMQPVLSAINDAIKANGQGVSIDDIASRFMRLIQSQPFVVVRKTSEEDGEAVTEIKRCGELFAADRTILKRECKLALLHQITAPLRSRNGIVGLGLAYAHVDWNGDQRDDLPVRLPELFSASPEEGWNVLQALLSIILRRRAITFPDGLQLSHMMTQGPVAISYHLSCNDRIERRQRFRWNPYTASRLREKQRANVIRRSPQAEVIARFLGKDKLSDEAEISTLLEKIWTAFRDLQVLESPWAGEFQLPSDHVVMSTTENWHSCKKCGVLTPFPIKSLCIVPNCGGILAPIQPTEKIARIANHHWFHRYSFTDALPLKVKEHTAQLTNDVGQEYQRLFTAGDVNVLSSSTTFELGVDVGQLKTVLLRNVPPTPANYIQRAGRAGRRKEGAAYAVTFSRSVPHDQVHFHKPEAIVNGTVPVPRINMANERLTQRHINSFLLGAYLRKANISGAGEQIILEEFFLIPSAQSSPASLFPGWLAQNRTALKPMVRNIPDPVCGLDIERAMDQSAAMLDNVAKDLAERLNEYEKEKRQLEEAMNQAASRDRVGFAIALQSVERLQKQLREERLIDFLASSHWLPSYAFPQDVMKLLVRKSELTKRFRLERDAEFAISEYSPGAEVVVDGKLVRSGGVDLRNREMEILNYQACTKCNRVRVWRSTDSFNPACPSCGEMRSPAKKFIEPKGFTTLFEEPVEDVRLHRTKPPFTSEIFLIEGADLLSFSTHASIPGISIGYRRDGELFRANSGTKGKQFRICRKCGRGFSTTSTKHKSPWGLNCSGGSIVTMDLACRFRTDTMQIRFDKMNPAPPTVDDHDFWHSFQTAFVAAAADVLAIPTNDLGGTFRSQTEGSLSGELVVYDRVPGGAGYVKRINDELGSVLRETLNRTEKCKNPQCDPLGSCYSCLRSYQNQFKWENLKRNLVADWLAQALEGNKQTASS